MSNKYAENTKIELEKALADKPNEFKKAVQSLIENSELVISESEVLRKDMTTVLAAADATAKNCLSLTAAIKHVHTFLGAHSDKFGDDKDFKGLMDGLAKFVLGSTSIKAGVVSLALEKEAKKNVE